MLIQAPKGTRDILPLEVYKWQYIEKIITKVCKNFGYREIRIPVFEYTELFERGVGDSTDIVRKQMYTFNDKGGRSITLRPEGTAGVVRSYIENGMASMPQPVKLYYDISAYRYENIQKGRYREFNQFGVEAFGSKGPSVDVEIISMLVLIFKKLNIGNVTLKINSIGCPACRSKYVDKLKKYLKPHLEELCNDCRIRYEKNPVRILDCKNKKCQEIISHAPVFIDNLCNECRTHFEGVKTGLKNLNIEYKVDSAIVRGLDYYTKTVFEFVSENVGTQGTICGGGRYDELVGTCGGKPTPGMGFALGMERLLLEMDSRGIVISRPEGIDIFIASVGDKAYEYAETLVFQLRCNGINAEKDLMYRSLKAQMKHADKLGATFVVVLGDEEIEKNRAVLKNLRNGEEKNVSLDSIQDRLKKNL
jgi:histidyl-tRNA synthetase